MQTLTLMNLTPPTIKKASPKSIDYLSIDDAKYQAPF